MNTTYNSRSPFYALIDDSPEIARSKRNATACPTTVHAYDGCAWLHYVSGCLGYWRRLGTLAEFDYKLAAGHYAAHALIAMERPEVCCIRCHREAEHVHLVTGGPTGWACGDCGAVLLQDGHGIIAYA